MDRFPTKHLALEGLEQGPAVGTLLVGERLFICDEARLRAVQVRNNSIEWEVPRSVPPPARYQAPRCIRSTWRPLWSGGDRIAQLVDVDEGVAIIAHESSSGREVWRCVLPTPAPLPWTESVPAWPGAQTEEISAFLAATHTPAVVMARTTRRTARWPDCPAPEFHAQLDVTCFEATDGRVAWSAHYPEVHVPILEKERFDGWHTADRQVLGIDWTNGERRPVAELAGDPSWPRSVGNRVAVASRLRGNVTVEVFDVPTKRLLSRATWPRKGVRETKLFALGGDLVLQLNDQFVSLLSEERSPRWEVRVKPYVYGVVALHDGPVLVCTSGNGGGLYGFDRRTGAEVMSERLSGGAWDPREVDGTQLTAFACGDGVAIVHGRSGRLAIIEHAGARRIVGTLDGHVVVLSGAPRPGVVVVDVRQAFQ